MPDDFQLSRKTLSSYYLAAIFSYLTFSLFEDFIIRLVRWVTVVLTSGFQLTVETNSWWVFFFVCLFITALIRKYVVQPLGFFVSKEGAPWWEMAIMVFLVLGFYIYGLNINFAGINMPAGFPIFFLKLFGDLNNPKLFTEDPTTTNPETWAFVPWLWFLGPILFLYFRTKIKLETEG